MIFCKKCGETIPEDSKVCPVCGCDLSQAEDTIVYASQKEMKLGKDENVKEAATITIESVKKKKTVGIIMCVLGYILLVIGIRAITSPTYKYNVGHYDYIMSEYRTTSQRSYSYGGWLGPSYANLASSWKDRADKVSTTIWVARSEAIIFSLAFVVLEIVGIKKIKTANKESQEL